MSLAWELRIAKLAALRELFPSVDPKTIETALYNSRENLDEAYVSH